ncbi:MAG: hypothetical protein Q8877_03170, partial [Sweet potato little leaf phytoplasma]|nr:hypothetical protein [Sweet potato little leaf phytoplasma]
ITFHHHHHLPSPPNPHNQGSPPSTSIISFSSFLGKSENPPHQAQKSSFPLPHHLKIIITKISSSPSSSLLKVYKTKNPSLSLCYFCEFLSLFLWPIFISLD